MLMSSSLRICALLLLASACQEPVSSGKPPGRVPVALHIAPWEHISMVSGTTLELRPLGLDSAADTVSFPGPIAFMSRGPEVVDVSIDGVIRAREPGAAWIIAWTYVGKRRLEDSLGVRVPCTRELRTTITPASAILRVGESVTPSFELSTCGGRQQLTDVFRWRSLDSLVVRVDSLSGRATAVAPGRTYVVVSGAFYGLLANMLIDVTN